MTLETERYGPVLVATIDRPHRLNAIDPATTAALDAALDAAEADDAVAAVILTGAGDRAFCSGMDLRHAAEHGFAGLRVEGKGFAAVTERRFEKPLLAAVNGAAVGGGFEIVLACDLAVAAEGATFGLPEVSRGLVAGGGGLVRIARQLPRKAALELAMTGRPFGAARAYELGLVNRVVPLDSLLEETLALAETVCANAPVAVRLSKELVDAVPHLGREEAWRLNREIVERVHRTEDSREGPRAFAERRPPRWSGR